MSDETPAAGCLAGHCEITGTRSGVHHNGGCNCLYGLDPEKRRVLRRELARLRAEVERLERRLGDVSEANRIHMAEVERLIRERDAAIFAADNTRKSERDIINVLEKVKSARDSAVERAETAERERDEARREVCRRRARDNGPAFGNDAEFERRARELAGRLGWGCFAAEHPEPGDGAMMPWCVECEACSKHARGERGGANG